MNVASLDLCRELYKLSGWDKTQNVWALASDGSKPWLRVGVGSSSAWTELPAYDLGYLIHALPAQTQITKKRTGFKAYIKGTITFWDDITTAADTPEDAAAALAIKLFNAGILQREATG